MDNESSQKEELLALQSIFEEKDLIIENHDPPRGRFIADVQIPSNFLIRYEDSFCHEEKNLQISYLPPIDLIFSLPNTYPLETCPDFMLSCPWLSELQLSNLCRKLENIWIEGHGEVILFSWVSFLQEETLQYLNITDTLVIANFAFKNVSEKQIELKTQDKLSETTCQPLNELHRNENDDSKTNHASFRECNKFDDKNNMNKVESTNDNTSPNRNIKSISDDVKSSVSGNSSIDSRVLSLCKSVSTLIVFLKEYDKRKVNEAFKHRIFTCQICFLDKRGYEFSIFETCGHKFCRECLKYYLEIQISDGNVHSLNCPDTSCSSQADGTLVKSLVSEDLFKKYDTLLLSRTLENMSDVSYCPRQLCQNPVLLEMESKMGRCPMCSFVFCVFCRMGYHGVAPCNLKIQEKQEIYKKYMESTSAEKLSMERRYGKKELKSLIDGILSDEWIDCNSKRCPSCSAQIEKNDGCNKMTCSRCRLYFCWICMAPLNSSNPYSHFSDVRSRCYNQLFPEDFEFVAPGEFLEL